MTGYLMEDSREAQRLADKVDPEAWVRRYLVPLDLNNKRILDVGCGPAVIAAELGRQFETATVVGIDASPQRIEAAHANIVDAPNVSVQIGDAHALPFEDESFDFVVCRFLMEYLPDKALAVQEMKRVLKPGGRLFLQDLDGQLVWHYPIDQSLQDGVEKALKLLEKSGFDPMVGRKLFHLCHAAGF
ncbi:MAG: class I SAM-dependent methyltransferase [Planctomycetaceae bacterium]